MKTFFIALIAAFGLSGAPAMAANDCTTLCDGAFYMTATPDTLQALIEGGADVNATDAAGKTPLHHAAKATPAVIKALLDAGADVNAVDTLDRAPIHFISAASTGENILLLLAAGADVNAQTANDWTPLHGVAKFGTPENVMVLIAAGADASLRNEMGETPFALAATNPRMADTEAYDLLEQAHWQ